jgi:multidrug efflux pump
MTLPELSIRRPVLAIVLSLAIVLFGVVGFSYLGVREYPAVDPPVINVSTTYTGASPDVIDSQITEPLEQVINGINGIRIISSTSREQNSNIRVEFNLDADLEAAANDVRDKVAQAVSRLPADANPPVVEKADADSEVIVFLTVQSDTKDILEVSNLASTLIKERIQTIPGVSSVRIFGEKRYAMRLWMDATRMAAHRVTPIDVQRALGAENVDLPSGRIEGQDTELSLRTAGTLSSPEQYDRLVVKREGGRAIEFRDVGIAELGPENSRTMVKRDFLPMIGVAVIPQPNTNAIAIADEFYQRLAQIRKEIPPEYKVEVGYDFTTYVRRSVLEVEETLAIAFVLVALIIYLFLRDWRSTIIPVIAIPVSIISAFFVMYVAGFSINILTLVGVVLAIGLVCDDAIVILENIYTKIEEGMSPLQAAVKGSQEVYFAVISTTVTLAAVFLPIIFLQGLTGRLFREFGVVVVASVLMSAFVALTLSPMMCRFLLKKHDTPSWFYRVTEPFFTALQGGYRKSLLWFMRARWLAFPLLAAITALIAWVGMRLPSELAPLEDRSNIRVGVRAPEGATFEYTEKNLDRVAQFVLDTVPEVSRTFSITAGFGGTVNTGTQNIYLLEPYARKRSQEEIFRQLSAGLNAITGLRCFPGQPPTIGSRFGGQPLQYVLQAPDLGSLAAILPKFLEKANANPVLRFIDADLKINRPQISLSIDRERATELDVSVLDIARTLQLGLGGQRFGYFLMKGKQYEVIGQMRKNDRDDPGDLRKLNVRAADGSLVSLDNLITFQENTSPAAIYRFNRYIAATISGGTAPGHTLGDGIKALDEIAKEVLPPTFSTSLAGQSRDFADSASSLVFAFVLALILIYLVLAAQFESFIDPLIILFTVPMSLAGALFSLWVFNQSLNVFSQIGIIMLIGLVTKNGILIVEFANHHKKEGLSIVDAAIASAAARFRPILMTSLSTVLGVLPIALSLGGSSGSRQSLGIAVVGGLLLSGFLTLYIVPAVYSYLARRIPSPEEAPAPVSAAPS